MNPVTMTDPTGMYPICENCTGNQQRNLIMNWSQAYGSAVSAGTAGVPGFDPAPPPPPPPPPITYMREGGDYAETSACSRACYGFGGSHARSGSDSGSIDWGMEDEEGGDDACTGFLGCLGHGLFVAGRALVNAPLTEAYVAVAMISGANCDWKPGLMVACVGAADWADGPRDGMTIGNTYATKNPAASDLTMKHEENHATDWAMGGPIGYPIEYGIDALLAGGDPCRQRLEQSAGFSEDVYPQCL
jgi:hypothetical protein